MHMFGSLTGIVMAVLAILIFFAIIKSMWKLVKFAIIAGIIWFALVYFGIV